MLSLQAIAIIAACGSGVALAFVNLVLGNFITLLSEFSSGRDVPDNFMSLVSKQSYVPTTRRRPVMKARHFADKSQALFRVHWHCPFRLHLPLLSHYDLYRP